MHMGPVNEIKEVTAKSYKGHRKILESNTKKGKLEYPLCISPTGCELTHFNRRNTASIYEA
jgi:hypothetical protein